MRLDHPDHLNLIFPQWQGSGHSNALFYGSRALESLCRDISFQSIPVPESERLEKEHQILGYSSILTQLGWAADRIRETGPRSILTLGGDCSVELAPISYLNQSGSVGLIWLDAHPDLNTPESSPSGHFHGMPLRALLGDTDQSIRERCFSTLLPDQVILAGIRDMDLPEKQFIQREKITCISVQEMEQDPKILPEIVMEKGFSRLYIHIDLDVLDPGVYPFSSLPVPGGLMPDTLVKTVAALKDTADIVGLSLLEFIAEPCSTDHGNGAPKTPGQLSWQSVPLDLIQLFRE